MSKAALMLVPPPGLVSLTLSNVACLPSVFMTVSGVSLVAVSSKRTMNTLSYIVRRDINIPTAFLRISYLQLISMLPDLSSTRP